jgi:hypothetical protein
MHLYHIKYLVAGIKDYFFMLDIYRNKTFVLSTAKNKVNSKRNRPGDCFKTGEPGIYDHGFSN